MCFEKPTNKSETSVEPLKVTVIEEHNSLDENLTQTTEGEKVLEVEETSDAVSELNNSIRFG